MLDVQDLLKDIVKKETKELIEILSFIKSEYGHSVVGKIKELEEDKNLYVNETIITDKHIYYYAHGLGQARIDAYLPTSVEEQLSCLITFQQQGLSDCMFTFEEKQIKKILFNNIEDGFSKTRNFILYINDNKVGIQFPFTRFTTDNITAQQLCELINCLYEKYLENKLKMQRIIGASNFEEINQGEFKIIRTPLFIWNAMVDFAQKHDHFWGDTRWDIFHPLNLTNKNHIIIYKNHLDEVDADILAELFVYDINNNYVDIVWKAGYTPLTDKMDGFDNRIKWKVDYTHNWILEEFIPYIFYLGSIKSGNYLTRLFKKNNFEAFKSTFQYSLYDIRSLTINS